jgi:hypothetical protein
MGNQAVEARFNFFSVNMTNYVYTEQWIRKGLASDSVFVFYLFFLLSMYFFCCLCILIVLYVFLLLSMYSYCCLCILIVRPCILIVVYAYLSLSTYS